MNITEVRVKLMRNRSDRLRAFCSITIDGDFVVHDLRVIEGRKGLFVAMPSRKLTENCPRCGAKNELRAKFCGECGAGLNPERAERAAADKSHVDVAHPINTPCREMLQGTVLAAYHEEARNAGEAPSASAHDSAMDVDDSLDEFVDETESQWVASAVEESQLVLGDAADAGPSGSAVESDSVPEEESDDEPTEDPVSDFAGFGTQATEQAADIPAVAEDDPVDDTPLDVSELDATAEPDGDEAEPDGDEAEPDGDEAEPDEDEAESGGARDGQRRFRSRPRKRSSGFGEGIL